MMLEKEDDEWCIKYQILFYRNLHPDPRRQIFLE